MKQKVKRNDTIGDLYPIIRRILFFCRCLCCSSIKLDEKKLAQVSKIENCFQIVVTILEGFLSFRKLITIMNELSIDNPYRTLSRIQFSEKCVNSIINFYQWRRHNGKLKKIFEKIKIINVAIEINKIQEDHFRKKAMQWMILFIIFLILHLITNQSVSESVFFQINHYFAIGWLMIQELLPEIIFWMVLTISNYYMENLNSELKNMIKPKKNIHFVHGINDESERVRELRQILRQIDFIVDDLTEIFGFRLSMSILQMFIDFIYFLFLNLTLARYFPETVTNELALDMLHINIWILIHSYRFYQYLKVASKFAETGRKTPIILHELLVEDIDNNSKKELAIFSQVLLHRKNEISGIGFNLDYSLIPTIVSAVVMHIMVILQFNLPGYENGIKPFEDLIMKQ